MNRFLSIVMILCVGLFCAIGCNKPAAKPTAPAPVTKEEPKADMPKGEEPKAEAPKVEEKKMEEPKAEEKKAK
jgi:hypothetical protein